MAPHQAAKSAFLHIRIEPELLAAIRKVAKARGQSLSGFVREIFLAYLSPPPRVVVPAPPYDEQRAAELFAASAPRFVTVDDVDMTPPVDHGIVDSFVPRPSVGSPSERGR